MTKPKTDLEKRRDRMGRLHNKIVKAITESNVPIPESYLIIDEVKLQLMEAFRKVTVR